MLVARLIEVLDKLITSNSLKAFIFTGGYWKQEPRIWIQINFLKSFMEINIQTLDDAVAWRHTMMSLQKPSSTNQKQ